MDQLELGDEYALLDTLLGPLYVAWNKTGISSVIRAPNAEGSRTSSSASIIAPCDRRARCRATCPADSTCVV